MTLNFIAMLSHKHPNLLWALAGLGMIAEEKDSVMCATRWGLLMLSFLLGRFVAVAASSKRER